MIIEYLTKCEIENLFTFNKGVYPKRTIDVKNLDFWVSKNLDEVRLSIIVKGANQEIWGQILSSSMFYYYKESIQPGNWIFDYIVREDKRKDGYGIDLLQFGLRNKKVPIFATGSGPRALKIQLKMGFKRIGELKKYVGIKNPLYLLTSLFRGNLSPKKFPAFVKTQTAIFQLTNADQLSDITNPFNPGLLEFGRDSAFLKWRFFSNLHNYAFYKKVDSDTYFVVRTIVKKRITCLVLVDYRCDFSNQNDFHMLLRAVKKVASKLKLAVLITGSSLKIADEILEKQGFKAKGRPRPIISTEKYKEEQQRINNRELVFATLADSDGEINW